MTAKNPRFSVVVVGAGPTGLVIANLLGKAGVQTLLIEANDATVSEPRAVSIDDESLRVVQQMDLLDVVQDEIISGYGSEYRAPSGKVFLRVKPTMQPYGHARRNAFRQPILEAQLRAGLARYPCVETRFSCRVEQLTEHEGGVTVAMRSREGISERIEADFALACDGAKSELREALGYTLKGKSLGERWLIVDLEDSPTPSTETIVFCNSRRPGIALPGPRLTRRYEFKLMPTETDEEMLSDECVSALLASHEVAPGSRIIRKTVYHFHARIADHWGRGRIWLAGDAAHLMPPFAGQGMNSGIRDAANLAWKITEIIRGRFGPALLLTYEQERRGHVAEMTQLALRMGEIFAPRSKLHGFGQRCLFRALSIWPTARNYFAEMKYKPAPRFSDGFLIRSSLSRRGMVGRMLPQPELRCNGMDPARLDDRLGDGFSLLGIDVNPELIATVSLGKAWDAIISRRLSLSVGDAPGLAGERGRLLVIRPDRYVMASFRADEIDSVRAELELLSEATWQ